MPRSLSLLTAGLALACLPAMAQPQKLLIAAYPPGGKSDAHPLAVVAENALFNEIQKQFPCLQDITTLDTVRDLLNHARDRAVLDNPLSDSEMANIMGSVGARHLMTLLVTPVGRNFALTVTAMDTRNAGVYMRDTISLGAGDAAVDAAEAFAKPFVAKLLEAGKPPHCPNGRWVGTVEYREEASEKTEERSHSNNSEIGPAHLTYNTIREYARKLLAKANLTFENAQCLPVWGGMNYGSASCTVRSPITYDFKDVTRDEKLSSGEDFCRTPEGSKWIPRNLSDVGIVDNAASGTSTAEVIISPRSDKKTFRIQITEFRTP
jgi:hypothetical protein